MADDSATQLTIQSHQSRSKVRLDQSLAQFNSSRGLQTDDTIRSN